MKNVNLWESGLSKNYTFFNTIEDFENYVNSSPVFKLVVKDNYEYGTPSSCLIEKKCLDNNISLTYVDDDHSIAVPSNSIISGTIMSTSFFEKYKERIINCMTNKLFGADEDFYDIPGFIFSDELLDKVLIKCKNLTLRDVELTEEQIEKIRSKFIDCTVYKNGEHETISSSRVLSFFTKKDLEKNDREFWFNKYLTDLEINNLKYLEDDSLIRLDFFDNSNNKHQSRNEILKVVNRLESLGKKVNVKLSLESRMDISDILPILENYKSVNLYIKVDLQDYTLEEYKKESDKLDDLVSGIKNSDMSNLEKYLAVYNIVKKYKPYKENEDDLDKSRYVKYLLDNEYMVCVGFANLLSVLLERVGIESCNYGTSVYSASVLEDGTSDKVKYEGGHARSLINLKDSKYGIDGYFLADATWDNNYCKGDLYNYALLPIDSMQKGNYLFSLSSEDYFLDVHSFEEFNKKVNALFNKEYRKNKYEKNEKRKILNAYSSIFTSIMKTLRQLDYEKYLYYESNITVSSFDRDEKFYTDFLTDFGNYVVDKVNKAIPHEVLAEAASYAVQYNRDEPDAFRRTYEETVLRSLDSYEDKCFPYEFGENDTLVDKGKSL